MLWARLFLSSYICAVTALDEKISVCPDEHTIELASVEDVKILALKLTNLGNEPAYISFWANDTYNNAEATLWKKGLSKNKRSKSVRSGALYYPQVSGNIFDSFPPTSVTPTKFLIHLTPSNVSHTFSASRVASDAAHRRGDCIVTGKSWLSPVHCRGLTTLSRSATRCAPYIRYWDEDIWEVSVPDAASKCTVDDVNSFIKALRKAVPIDGVEQDLHRPVDPIGVYQVSPTRMHVPMKSSERPLIQNKTSMYTFDPALPPNEWYYQDLDYPYEAWTQMNVSGQREYLASLPSSRAVTIMVIDTMVELGHPDLQGGWYANVAEINGVDGVDDDGDGVVDNRYGLNGEDISTGDPTPIDGNNDHGHGVSSIVIATPNNDYSIAGLAPHLRILPCSGGTNMISVLASVNCMKYAVANAKRLNIRVVNHSYAGSTPANVELRAHQDLYAAGIISTIATANSDNNLDDPSATPVYPLMYLTDNDLYTIFPAARHDRGTYKACGYSKEWIDYLVQGATMVSKYSWTNVDGWAEGTSFAAPTLAAIIGSMLSVNPKLTHYDIRWILRNSLQHVDGFEKYCTYSGYPNLDKALWGARGTWLTTEADVVTIAAGETKTVEFKIAPSMDIYRLTDTAKAANIILYGQDPEDLTNVYKLGEVPVKVTIGSRYD